MVTTSDCEINIDDLQVSETSPVSPDVFLRGCIQVAKSRGADTFSLSVLEFERYFDKCENGFLELSEEMRETESELASYVDRAETAEGRIYAASEAVQSLRGMLCRLLPHVRGSNRDSVRAILSLVEHISGELEDV